MSYDPVTIEVIIIDYVQPETQFIACMEQLVRHFETTDLVETLEPKKIDVALEYILKNRNTK